MKSEHYTEREIMLLFYIRHGHPTYNPDDLTPLGMEQAKALSKRLVSYGIDEIYASPKIRAQKTAEPTANLLGKEIKILDWADESKAGSYFWYKDEKFSGWCWSHPETIRKFSSPQVCAMGSRWYEHPHFQGTKYAEGIRMTECGVDEFMLEQGYLHDRESCLYKAEFRNEKRIAIFAHQGAGMSILSSLLDIPYPIFSTRFDFGHSSMTVIKFGFPEDGAHAPRVLQLSNDSHLYREGLMTGYNGGYKF